MNDTAAQYWRWLEAEMQDCDIVLCHRPLGKHPQYFCGFHPRRRDPIYTYDAKLARRFGLHDQQLIRAFIEHIKNTHGHELFVTKHKPVSPRHAGNISKEKTKHA